MIVPLLSNFIENTEILQHINIIVKKGLEAILQYIKLDFTLCIKLLNLTGCLIKIKVPLLTDFRVNTRQKKY